MRTILSKDTLHIGPANLETVYWMEGRSQSPPMRIRRQILARMAKIYGKIFVPGWSDSTLSVLRSCGVNVDLPQELVLLVSACVSDKVRPLPLQMQRIENLFGKSVVRVVRATTLDTGYNEEVMLASLRDMDDDVGPAARYLALARKVAEYEEFLMVEPSLVGTLGLPADASENLREFMAIVRDTDHTCCPHGQGIVRMSRELIEELQELQLIAA